jgi:hypothetical protein
VTSAPRPVSTVECTLAELRRAGFDQTIHVFAEPETELREQLGVVLTRNHRRLGIWGNWRSAAACLLDNTDAPFLLICQDDLVLAPCAAAALQHAIQTLPHDDWGYASLYTPRNVVHHVTLTPGWQTVDGKGSSWGALAYCLTREALSELLASPDALGHRAPNGIDHMISRALGRLGRRRYFHSPSLAAHAGAGNSTVDHSAIADSAAIGFSAGYDDYRWADSPLGNNGPKNQTRRVPLQGRENGRARTQPVRCDVVIPYHAGDVRWLPVSVDSILNQQGAEVIVHLINDGVDEDDDLGRLFDHLDCVRRYRNEPGGIGPYVSTNRIFRHLETEYLAVQDADDIALPDRIRRSVLALETAPADVFAAGMEQFLDFEDRGNKPLEARLAGAPVLISGGKSTSNPHGFVVNGTMVIRRSTYKTVGGFPNWKCTGDVEFCERAIRLGARPVFSSAIVARRRLRDESLSNCEQYNIQSAARRRFRSECRRRLTDYAQPKIDPRLFGGLHLEQNGIGTVKLK